MMTKIDIIGLGKSIAEGYVITAEEALELSVTDEKPALYETANRIRKEVCGDKFDLCSIVNARSGRCSEDCKWCSQSVHHNCAINEYEIIPQEEAIMTALNNRSRGVHRFSLVTSGRTATSEQIRRYAGIYRQIREQSDISLCASMGLLEREQLRELRLSGVVHYHCNIETAPSFFPKLCSTHTLQEKEKTIRIAREEGLKICSGVIIGMGETMAQRVEMALYLRDLGVLSIPMNILMPIKGTPLENMEPLPQEEILTTIALFRFINPKANIRFAGGRDNIVSRQAEALSAGINASLVGDYLTTIGSTTIEQDISAFKAAGFNIE